MKILSALIVVGALGLMPAAVEAQHPFVHRPHFNQRHQFPERKPTYETYYMRKFGTLPPFARVPVPEPTMPPGFWLNDIYVPGVGFARGAPEVPGTP
jgi:hypothetical protein